MNGCDFLFTAGTYTPAFGIAHGSLHIGGCATGTSITIDVYQPGTKPEEHTNPAKLFCLIHVPEQTIASGITYTNGTTEGEMAVTVTATNAPITTTITKGTTAPCNVHRHENATYSGSLWAKGTNALGEYVDTTVTEKK